MFLGHFGVAFAAKKAAPKTSLGTLVFAAQFADMLWPILLLLGVERVRIVPGLLPASPFDFTSYPISHSLVAQLGWGALLGLIYFAIRRDARSALLVGGLVPTHWVLDFVAHRPDMPIYPGGPRVRTRNVEFHSLDDFSGVRSVCGGDRALHQRDSRERYNRKISFLVARWFARRSLPCVFVRASASQRARSCMERDRHLAHGAMGCVGRPASARRLG